jgi:hypothetical protein
LQTTSNAMVPSEIVPAWLTIGSMASWPENSTASAGWPVICEKGSGA